MPSIVAKIKASLAVGFVTIKSVAIALVEAGTVKLSGNLAKQPCEIAAEAKVVVEVIKVNIEVVGTAVTVNTPSVPVVPVLTLTISPMARP